MIPKNVDPVKTLSESDAETPIVKTPEKGKIKM